MKYKIFGIRYLFFFCLTALALGGAMSTPAYAAEKGLSEKLTETGETKQPPLVQKVVVIAGLSLLPFAIMLLTSFLKMVIVLSLLRQALGVQNSPPNQVINGMALLMAIYVMFPTCLSMYKEAETYIESAAPKNGDILSEASVEYLIGVLDKGKEPMRKFLVKNTIPKHTNYFYQLAKQKFPPPFKNELKPNDFIILVPAYITSEVKGAFEIGVLIYLPFFVIDLVTSNILLAMGMMMLSPLTIALPLKLLLLVMVDGWTLIVEGVVLTYR
jgi:type III secretion protein R